MMRKTAVVNAERQMAVQETLILLPTAMQRTAPVNAPKPSTHVQMTGRLVQKVHADAEQTKRVTQQPHTAMLRTTDVLQVGS